MPQSEIPREKPSTEPRRQLSRVAPDIVEQELGEAIDDIVPSYGYDVMPMVGIGGSAGAIAALKAFFSAVRPDTGMVYVVVLHLSPDRETALPEIIQSWTSMKVLQAKDGVKAEPNTVYIIPPGKQLTAVNGHLRIFDLVREQGRRGAVDLFFRSLADSHGAHAAAVILSGADSDGTLGIRRIKERGGLTIAQDPNEAEHNSMPRAAIATGMVDWVLPAGEMPQRLAEYIARERDLTLPPEEGPQPVTPPVGPNPSEAAFREILFFLRTRTGRDLSYYKRATMVRRISRRMQVNGIKDMASYLIFMRAHQGEVGALLKDLLISVTNFFRDRDSFEALRQSIPELFAHKTHGDTVRVWVPACATGEEAYAIAILLLEHARTLDTPPALQVFGCDLDDAAIQTARAGLYSEALAADVSEERLKTFFVKEHAGYRVRRELRETVLFASHDLLKDAGFSRVDLISCRNLLIYLNPEAQRRAFEIFHFALRPEGLLFLGSSESAEEGSALFRVLDKKHRIFRRKTSARGGLPVPAGPSNLLVHQIEQQVAADHQAESRSSDPTRPAEIGRRPELGALARREGARISWAEVHFKLLERFGPPSVLVDHEYDIQHLSESSGKFLRVAGGEPTTNLLRLVNPALRIELRGALLRASQSGLPAEALRVPAEIDGAQALVDIRVAAAKDLEREFLLVSFALHRPSAGDSAAAVPPPEPLVQQLEQEIELMKVHLRDTVEQYEASTEELKASNEELQAMNEELRSAAEELETSREELQSINEELTTVNQELKSKIEEVGHVNSDLQNLMGATAIATLFLDRDLNIMRFTDSARALFKIIPGDVGRPLSDLQRQVDYPELAADSERVLATLALLEREIQGEGGRCYLARVLPYRTIDDRIAGVVLAFVDITERKEAEKALAEELRNTEILRFASEKLTKDNEMHDVFDAILNAAMSLTRADAGSVQLVDTGSAELRLLATTGISKDLVNRFAQGGAGSATLFGLALTSGKRTVVHFDDPTAATAADYTEAHLQAGFRSAQAMPLVSRAGRRIGVLSTLWRKNYLPGERELRFLHLLARQAADALDRKQAEDALKQQMEELTRFNRAAVGRETRMIELKKEVNELAARLGEAPRYPLKFIQDAGV